MEITGKRAGLTSRRYETQARFQIQVTPTPKQAGRWSDLRVNVEVRERVNDSWPWQEASPGLAEDYLSMVLQAILDRISVKRRER
jgi:hypothetical protein